MKYGYTRSVPLAFDEAVDRTREELSKEGFGVLTEIDVKKVLKAKLDVDYEDYIILGACNPPRRLCSGYTAPLPWSSSNQAARR